MIKQHILQTTLKLDKIEADQDEERNKTKRDTSSTDRVNRVEQNLNDASINPGYETNVKIKLANRRIKVQVD